jgi:hypothetical protein
MKTFRLVLTVFMGVFIAANAFAENLGTLDIEALARNAIRTEVETLNASIGNGDPSIPLRFITGLERQGSDRIAPEYLFGKCMLNGENLISMIDRTLTDADDATKMRENALRGVRMSEGKVIWKLVSRLCERAEERFARRLENLESNGVPIVLSDEARSHLRQVVFFPTENGKPSFRTAAESVLSVALASATFIGTSGVLIGFPIAGKLILSSGMTGSGFGLITRILQKRLPLANSNELAISVDLTDLERAEILNDNPSKIDRP